jgi:hypothetical protein
LRNISVGDAYFIIYHPFCTASAGAYSDADAANAGADVCSVSAARTTLSVDPRLSPPPSAAAPFHRQHAGRAEDGLAILKRIKTMRIGTPVYHHRGPARSGSAVLAMKAGASDVFPNRSNPEGWCAPRDARQDIQLGTVVGAAAAVEVRGS